MYLKLLAFYTIELHSLGGVSKAAEDIILNTMSGLMYNLEFGNEQFRHTLFRLRSIIVDSKNTYLSICKSRGIEPKFIKTNLKVTNKLDLTSLIRLGEQEYTNKTEHLMPDRKNLFEIMFFIIKSLCINLVDIKSYEVNDSIEKTAYDEILILLNFLNYMDARLKDILHEIDKSVEINSQLLRIIRQAKIDRYGKPEPAEVSYSTRPNKAILVAGTNIRELEKVLEFTKDKNIDVYTHGEMILAHMFPAFKKYPHLRGQYGTGVENCLLDFATFPGAILIAKHSLENIEYLYRGRLFTTDNFVPPGVIKVNNDDFTQLVQSTLNAKGFKKGKQRESITVGCAIDEIGASLEPFLQNIKKYKQVIIIAPESNSQRNRLYFETLLKLIPDDIFVITLSYSKESENVLYLNATSDFPFTYTILDVIHEKTKELGMDISLFVSKCDKHVISNIINIKRLGVKNLFLSKCSPITLNPTLIQILDKAYNIKQATYAPNDLEQIINPQD